MPQSVVIWQSAVTVCGQSGGFVSDDGYMHCTSDSWVEWGNSAAVESQFVVARLSIDSNSALLYERVRDYYSIDIAVLRHWENWYICEDATNAKHEEAYDAYKRHKSVIGTGEAKLALTLAAIPGVVPGLTDDAKQLAPDAGAYIDLGAGLLLVGCDATGRPLDVSMRITSSCGGAQLISEPGATG